jgi:hypothetical protein
MLCLKRLDAGKWSRLTVIRAPHGWQVRKEREGASDRVSLVTDWHRVERSIQLFTHSEDRLGQALSV